MITVGTKVRVSPDNVRILEMLRTPTDKLVGRVIDVYHPPPFSNDVRPRMCVRLEIDEKWGYYGLFYENEIFEVFA